MQEKKNLIDHTGHKRRDTFQILYEQNLWVCVFAGKIWSSYSIVKP